MSSLSKRVFVYHVHHLLNRHILDTCIVEKHFKDSYGHE